MSEPIHIVCGHCDSVVRVPAGRIAHAPRCPKCRSDLLGGRPLTLTSANFDKHASRNDLPLVVDVWAPWCAPCRMMAPHFDAAAERFATCCRFGKVNSDEHPALSSRFGIRGIPTLIAFRQGREIARQSGAMDLSSLSNWVEGVLRR